MNGARQKLEIDAVERHDRAEPLGQADSFQRARRRDTCRARGGCSRVVGPVGRERRRQSARSRQQPAVRDPQGAHHDQGDEQRLEPVLAETLEVPELDEPAQHRQHGDADEASCRRNRPPRTTAMKSFAETSGP